MPLRTELWSFCSWAFCMFLRIFWIHGIIAKPQTIMERKTLDNSISLILKSWNIFITWCSQILYHVLKTLRCCLYADAKKLNCSRMTRPWLADSIDSHPYIHFWPNVFETYILRNPNLCFHTKGYFDYWLAPIPM